MLARGRGVHGAGSGAGRASEEKLFNFFSPFHVVVNPSAFHNKSQIINKYIPLMTRLFNSRNWKMLRRFFYFFIFFPLSPLGAVLSP